MFSLVLKGCLIESVTEAIVKVKSRLSSRTYLNFDLMVQTIYQKILKYNLSIKQTKLSVLKKGTHNIGFK